MNLLKLKNFDDSSHKKNPVFDVINYHAIIKNVMDIIVLINMIYILFKLKLHKSQLGDQIKIFHTT